MSITGALVIYTLVWWATFFVVLPWNIRSQWEDKANMPEGSDPGAPIEPQMKKKALRTSWIAAIISGVIIAIIISGVIDLRQ